jgi:hypothetical protein
MYKSFPGTVVVGSVTSIGRKMGFHASNRAILLSLIRVRIVLLSTGVPVGASTANFLSIKNTPPFMTLLFFNSLKEHTYPKPFFEISFKAHLMKLPVEHYTSSSIYTVLPSPMRIFTEVYTAPLKQSRVLHSAMRLPQQCLKAKRNLVRGRIAEGKVHFFSRGSQIPNENLFITVTDLAI